LSPNNKKPAEQAGDFFIIIFIRFVTNRLFDELRSITSQQWLLLLLCFIFIIGPLGLPPLGRFFDRALSLKLAEILMENIGISNLFLPEFWNFFFIVTKLQYFQCGDQLQ
jgi:hypothetical protein